MYYITNQNNQIIAVDPSLLALLEVENIDDLYRNIALGDIHFSSLKEEHKVTITKAQNKKIYDAMNTDLSGMLGNITLVEIQASSEESMPAEDDISTLTLTKEDEMPFIPKDSTQSAEEPLFLDVSDVTHKEEMPFFDDTLISIKEDEDTVEKDASVLDKPEEEEKKEEEDELFDLLLPSTAEETIDKITTSKEAETQTDTASQTPIFIDVENISQSIGISTEDYNTFLNEYIDTALSLEEELRSPHQEKRSSAVGELTHLSNFLRLPAVSEIVKHIGDAASENQSAHIASFYTTLGRLTTSPLDRDDTVASSIPIIDPDIQGETVDLEDIEKLDIYKEEPLCAPQSEHTTAAQEGFGSIDLDDVDPIHFDFQLEQAADELSLPVELIEEFVHDFIEQAHTETQKMLEAYEKGDLDTIQKIGHLLKGTSSNLRISPLSNTLYEIQFCEDSNKLEELIRNYWGHFLSLETQINIKRK